MMNLMNMIIYSDLVPDIKEVKNILGEYKNLR